MNQGNKIRWANILTALASAFAIVQTLFTHPPFSEAQAYLLSSACVTLVSIFTVWKQYLSPEVSNAGARITFWAAVVATAAGVFDYFNLIPVKPETAVWIKWGESVILALLSILSKQIFPSEDQKEVYRKIKYNK